MALPTPGPGVAFTLEDLSTDDTATIQLVRLVGKITGTFKRTMGGTAVVVQDRNIIEDRTYTPPLEPTAGVVSFYCSPLQWNASSTDANAIGGAYEYVAYVKILNVAELMEIKYRFILDEDDEGGYTLDSDGRVPYAQVATDDESVPLLNTGTALLAKLTPLGVTATHSWSVAVFDSSTTCATGDGAIGFCVPPELDGMNLESVTAATPTAGTTGVMTVQARRVRAGAAVDMLTTPATIDSGEYSTATAATPAAVDTSNDDLATGDLIYPDVDTVHTTPAQGLTVTFTAGV